MVKHRFRPQMSVSFPPGIISAAMTNRKMVMAVCTPCTVVPRALLMSVIITFMLEPAKLQMNCARASGTRTLRKDTDGLPDASAMIVDQHVGERRTADALSVGTRVATVVTLRG